jgi:hypothetical protein
MVINFKARGIRRGARKLARTPTLINKKNYNFKVLLQVCAYRFFYMIHSYYFNFLASYSWFFYTYFISYNGLLNLFCT